MAKVLFYLATDAMPTEKKYATPSSKFKPFLTVVILLTTITGIYAPGLQGDFLFDDIANLVHSSAWRLTEWTHAQIGRAMGHGISSPSGRPLALLSFAVNHYWFGSSPYWLKAGNLFLHLINTALIWLLALRLLRQTVPSNRSAETLAVLVAALWALHPLQVSTVLYIVQRMEIGAATGTLLALYAYIRARSDGHGWARQSTWLTLAGVACAAGLLFKETAVLTFGFAFLLELFFFKFRQPNGNRSTAWITAYTLASVTALLIICFWLWPTVTYYEHRNFTLEERLLTQGSVLAMYLIQILAPLPDFFKFYYDDFPISTSLIQPIHTLIAWLMIGGVILLGWSLRRRSPLVSFGILWFFIAHSLTSSFIPLELAFEHRNYLALLGIVLASVAALTEMSHRISSDAYRPMALAVLFTLAFLTTVQTLTWGKPAVLALTLELRAKTSQRAAYALGAQMMTAGNQNYSSPQWAMARKQMEHASELPGNSALPQFTLLLMDGQAGTPPSPSAWNRLRATLVSTPLIADHINGLKKLVDCRVSGDCTLDDRELLRTIALLLEAHPKQLMLHMIYSNFAWSAMHDHELAVRIQRQAVAIAPNDPGQKLLLGHYLATIGTPDSLTEATVLVELLKHNDRHELMSDSLAQLRSTIEKTQAEHEKLRPFDPISNSY